MGAPGLSAAAAGHESPLCYRAGGRLSAQLVFSWGAGPTAEPFLPTHVLTEVGGRRLRARWPSSQVKGSGWPTPGRCLACFRGPGRGLSVSETRESTAPPWGTVWPGPGSSPARFGSVLFLLSCSGLPSPEAPWRLRTHAPRPRLAVSSTSRFSLRSLGEKRSRDRKNVLSAWGERPLHLPLIPGSRIQQAAWDSSSHVGGGGELGPAPRTPRPPDQAPQHPGGGAHCSLAVPICLSFPSCQGVHPAQGHPHMLSSHLPSQPQSRFWKCTRTLLETLRPDSFPSPAGLWTPRQPRPLIRCHVLPDASYRFI